MNADLPPESETTTSESPDLSASPVTDPALRRGPIRTAVRWILRDIPAAGLIGLVRLYQMGISPLIGPCCRFTPSCSNYFIEAVRKRGPIVGTIKGVWRICRCHPLHPGGYDPPT